MPTPRTFGSLSNAASVFYSPKVQPGPRYVPLKARCPKETTNGIEQHRATPPSERPSLARIALEIPLLHGQRNPRTENIETGSLSATINAHRNAKLARRIRKYVGRDSIKKRHEELRSRIKMAGKAGEPAPKFHSVYTEVPREPTSLVRKIDGELQHNGQFLASFIPPLLTLRLSHSSNSQER